MWSKRASWGVRRGLSCVAHTPAAGRKLHVRRQPATASGRETLSRQGEGGDAGKARQQASWCRAEARRRMKAGGGASSEPLTPGYSKSVLLTRRAGYLLTLTCRIGRSRGDLERFADTCPG